MKANMKTTKSRELKISSVAVESAKTGLNLLKGAILEVIHANPEGVSNTELARLLNLESDFNGNQKNYLTYSLLGLLLKENKIHRDERTKKFII